jgi:chemotaxis protein methyltransferase WspC
LPSARPERHRPAKLAPVDDTPSLLERASQLADEGSLDAAAAICRQLVERENPRAEAYCLLGLIEEALGDRLRAEGSYTRALFLDSNHYESLIHLILLVESRGDATRAAALRARVGRIREQENRHAG